MGTNSISIAMKEEIKNILKQLKIYHLLQSNYRELLELINKKYYQLKYYKHRNKGFTCNFCGKKYEKFVDSYPSPNISGALQRNNVIAGPGENVYCPNCLSKNRERLVKAVLENLLEVRDKEILHFSPEKKLYQFLSKISRVKTVDISPGFYHHIDKKVSYADITNLQFSDCTYDIVIANHILEHVPDDKKAMSEIFRVLRFDGFAVLQIPYSETLVDTLEDPNINDPAKQEELYGQNDHVRIYALQNYIDRLKGAGFIVKLLRPEELLPFRKYAIQEKESVILGYKK